MIPMLGFLTDEQLRQYISVYTFQPKRSDELRVRSSFSITIAFRKLFICYGLPHPEDEGIDEPASLMRSRNE